jgi:signal peptidase
MAKSRYTTPEQIAELREEIRLEKEKTAGRRAKDAAGGKIKNPGGRRTLPAASTVVTVGGWVVFLSVVLLLTSTIIAVNVAKSRGELPSIGGFQLFAVESGSMEPTLKTGSLILSRKPADPASLQEKQIVTFRTSTGYIVTHRIIEVVKTEDGGVAYRTKGDNPVNSPDQELLTPDRVIAVFRARIPFT